MKIKDGFVLRTIMNENIVIPTNKDICQIEGVLRLNSVASFAWKQLQKECSKEDLIAAICLEYDVLKDQCEKDIDELLDMLIKMGIIEI